VSVPFTPESEIHNAIRRLIAAFDFEALAQRAMNNALNRSRGRV
jgi:hypothetical protein